MNSALLIFCIFLIIELFYISCRFSGELVLWKNRRLFKHAIVYEVTINIEETASVIQYFVDEQALVRWESVVFDDEKKIEPLNRYFMLYIMYFNDGGYFSWICRYYTVYHF